MGTCEKIIEPFMENVASSQSSSISNIVNSALTEHTQSTSDSLKQRLQMSQVQTIVMDNIDASDGCSINIGQKMTAELSATLQTLHNMSSDTISSVAATAAQTLETKLSQKNEDVGFGQSNRAYSSSHIRSDIENAIKSTTEQMSESMIDMGAIMNQEQNITLKNIKCSGEGTQVNFTQDMAISMFADQVAQNMFSASSQNNAVATATQTVSTIIDQHNKGIDIMAICVSSCIAIVLLALIGGVTSSKMYEDTPDEAKVAVAEAAGEALKAKSGKIGGKGKNIKYGIIGGALPLVKVVIGVVCAIIVLIGMIFLYKKIIRPCVKKDERVVEEQPMGEDYEEENDCPDWWPF